MSSPIERNELWELTLAYNELKQIEQSVFRIDEGATLGTLGLVFRLNFLIREGANGYEPSNKATNYYS